MRGKHFTSLTCGDAHLGPREWTRLTVSHSSTRGATRLGYKSGYSRRPKDTRTLRGSFLAKTML
jgi:hypothetical protein